MNKKEFAKTIVETMDSFAKLRSMQAVQLITGDKKGVEENETLGKELKESLVELIEMQIS